MYMNMWLHFTCRTETNCFFNMICYSLCIKVHSKFTCIMSQDSYFCSDNVAEYNIHWFFNYIPDELWETFFYMYLLLIHISSGNCLVETAKVLQSRKIGTHKICNEYTVSSTTVLLGKYFNVPIFCWKFLFFVVHNTDSFTIDFQSCLQFHAN